MREGWGCGGWRWTINCSLWRMDFPSIMHEADPQAVLRGLARSDAWVVTGRYGQWCMDQITLLACDRPVHQSNHYLSFAARQTLDVVEMNPLISSIPNSHLCKHKHPSPPCHMSHNFQPIETTVSKQKWQTVFLYNIVENVIVPGVQCRRTSWLS